MTIIIIIIIIGESTVTYSSLSVIKTCFCFYVQAFAWLFLLPDVLTKHEYTSGIIYICS